MTKGRKKTVQEKQTAIRLTPEDQAIAKELQEKLGLNLTSVIRLALRRLREEFARRNDYAAD